MTTDGQPSPDTFARLETGNHFPFSCEVQTRRAGMTEDEYWQDVADMLAHGRPLSDEEREAMHSDFDFDPPRSELDMGPCPECGEHGACGYDALGRPLIHPTRADED